MSWLWRLGIDTRSYILCGSIGQSVMSASDFRFPWHMEMVEVFRNKVNAPGYWLFLLYMSIVIVISAHQNGTLSFNMASNHVS